MVKIIVFLKLEPRLNIKTDLTGQAKLSIFQRSQFELNRPRSDSAQKLSDSANSACPVKCGAYFSGVRDKQDPFRVTIMPTSLGVDIDFKDLTNEQK